MVGISVEWMVEDAELVVRGRLVECGGIWKKQNRETGADYFTLTIRDFGFNANLGKAAHQDDETLQAVIPWGPKDG